jgi:subtilase family serine protease
VRKGRTVALAAGASVLAAAVVTAAAPAAPAASRPAATARASAPLVTIKPGVVHPAAVMTTPSPLNCEKLYHVSCYVPAQVEHAYNLGPLFHRGITGKGETIVIVDSFGSPTAQKDLTTFDSTFHLPAPPSFRVIAPAGKIPKWDPNNSDMTGWAGETTLDVEWAHAIAPGASILLVETPVSETEGVTGFPQIVEAENYVLAHYRTAVISQSFSATEQTFTGIKQLTPLRAAYIRAAAQKDGPTVLSASGDSGAANVGLDGTTYYTYPTTEWPPSDPLVTGIGGTELVPGKNGSFSSVAWNDTYNPNIGAGVNPSATGGALSVLFPRPAYQNGVTSVVGTARGVPDISMSAACEGSVVTYQSFPATGEPAGWYPACGTSEATPEFAGIVALADQVAGHPLGLINQRLYQLSAQKAPGIVDVTKGNNTVTFVQGGKKVTVRGFYARPGYDLVTGVGTVNAWYLAYELAGKPVP